MSKEKIQSLIDRVIGKKGILRAPAWWVRRLFNEVVGYVENLTNKKPDIYILQAGEYAVDSEIGKELLEILNNPDKYILQSWVNVTGGKILVGYDKTKYDIITGSHIVLVGYARQTSTLTEGGKLVEVGFTQYSGVIAKNDDVILVSFSEMGESMPFGKGIDDEMSASSEYTVSNKVIKAYVDSSKVTVDSSISDTSKNPVQNKVVKAAIDAKQDLLVSGTNIKTINNESILGEGNITIEGGGSVEADTEMSNTSENPVQNKVIKAYVDGLVGEINTVLDTINGEEI